MPKIKRLSDNSTIIVSAYPKWVLGTWECGDQRFDDPQENLYVAVGFPLLLVSAGRFYSLFSNQQQQDVEGSNDPVVKQLLRNVTIMIQSGDPVDLSSSVVQQGLGYLATIAVSPVPANAPTPRNYIQLADIARISQNVLP